MNLIILKPEELTEDGSVLLADRRALHIITVLRGELGQSVRIGILNGAIGMGVIEEITMAHVRLSCSFNDAHGPVQDIDLILAMPRPLVMKRLLAPLVTLGVHRIFLTNANKVEKDYFGTHWIRSENYEPCLIEGLEQAGDTHLPQVTIVRKLKPFVEDRMDALFPSGTRILAHPSPEQDTHGISHCPTPVVLAFGPEGGWTPYEMNLFARNGFLQMSLGPRTLRTDVACIAMISVIRHLINA